MSIQLKKYSLSEMYENGTRIHFNENAATYDGNTMDVITNDNGDILYQTLSEKDIQGLLFKKRKNTISLTDRLEKRFIKGKTYSKPKTRKRYLHAKRKTRKRSPVTLVSKRSKKSKSRR